MGKSGITINGQHYQSPDEMPPDVRRQYDAAMRALGPALAGGTGSDTTQVFTGPTSSDAHGSIVIHKAITVNRTYESLDSMPPEVRRLVESQGRDAGAPTEPSLHVSFKVSRPEVRTGSSSAETPLPLKPSNVESKARDLVWSLAFWVAVALVLWAFLGR